MGRCRAAVVLSVVAFMLLAPSVACADGAVPAFMLAYPGMIVLLIPIVAIEAGVLAWLLGIGVRRAAIAASASNGVSTLLGVPLTGILVALAPLLLEPVIARSGRVPDWAQGLVGLGWLYNGADNRVHPAASLAVLLIPFFFMSWGVEYRVSRRMLKDIDWGRVNRAVLLGNVLSYAMLAGVIVIMAVWFNG